MQNRLSALTQQAWIATIFAFILGVILGWLVLGWVLFPLQYTDADPWDLRASAKAQYVQMAADSFSLTQDKALAQERLRGFNQPELNSIVSSLVAERNRAGRGLEAQRLTAFAKAYGLNLSGAPVTTAPTPAPAAASSNLVDSVGPIALGLVLLAVVVGLGLLFFNRFRGADSMPSFTGRTSRQDVAYTEMPNMDATPVQPVATPPVINTPPQTATLPAMQTPVMQAPVQAPAPRTAPAPRGVPTPMAKTLGTFAATYKFGDDNYDTAFTLETARSEFLGECGMGISDTIGEGKPDKVTAFDLWLFDKTDVRTVTQILMSEHAYNDTNLRNKLAPKGDLTLAEKGKHLLLETATLRVDAEIVDLVYASTPGLPLNSHFQKLIVELVPVQK